MQPLRQLSLAATALLVALQAAHGLDVDEWLAPRLVQTQVAGDPLHHQFSLYHRHAGGQTTSLQFDVRKHDKVIHIDEDNSVGLESCTRTQLVLSVPTVDTASEWAVGHLICARPHLRCPHPDHGASRPILRRLESIVVVPNADGDGALVTLTTSRAAHTQFFESSDVRLFRSQAPPSSLAAAGNATAGAGRRLLSWWNGNYDITHTSSMSRSWATSANFGAGVRCDDCRVTATGSLEFEIKTHHYGLEKLKATLRGVLDASVGMSVTASGALSGSNSPELANERFGGFTFAIAGVPFHVEFKLGVEGVMAASIKESGHVSVVAASRGEFSAGVEYSGGLHWSHDHSISSRVDSHAGYSVEGDVTVGLKFTPGIVIDGALTVALGVTPHVRAEIKASRSVQTCYYGCYSSSSSSCYGCGNAARTCSVKLSVLPSISFDIEGDVDIKVLGHDVYEASLGSYSLGQVDFGGIGPVCLSRGRLLADAAGNASMPSPLPLQQLRERLSADSTARDCPLSCSGHGMCLPSSNGSRCHCGQGWTGEACDHVRIVYTPGGVAVGATHPQPAQCSGTCVDTADAATAAQLGVCRGRVGAQVCASSVATVALMDAEVGLELAAYRNHSVQCIEAMADLHCRSAMPRCDDVQRIVPVSFESCVEAAKLCTSTAGEAEAMCTLMSPSLQFEHAPVSAAGSPWNTDSVSPAQRSAAAPPTCLTVERLQACPHRNGRNVYLATEVFSTAAAADAHVGQRLKDNTAGMGAECVEALRERLCAQHLPLCVDGSPHQLLFSECVAIARKCPRLAGLADGTQAAAEEACSNSSDPFVAHFVAENPSSCGLSQEQASSIPTNNLMSSSTGEANGGGSAPSIGLLTVAGVAAVSALLACLATLSAVHVWRRTRRPGHTEGGTRQTVEMANPAHGVGREHTSV